MEFTEAYDLIRRLRYDQPRNDDVLAVCDLLERYLAAVQRGQFKAQADSKEAPKSFDRKTYMREYMRRRRKKVTVSSS